MEGVMCSKCGTEPPGKGGVLCPDCLKEIGTRTLGYWNTNTAEPQAAVVDDESVSPVS